jgi:DNA excision repair protein ERCC-3
MIMIRQEQKPLMLQNDLTIWLEADHPSFEIVRQQLIEFAELLKSPTHMHTYRITALSLWNAAALGKPKHEIIDFLYQYSKWGIPKLVLNHIQEWMDRYGYLKLLRRDGKLVLVSARDNLLQDLIKHTSIYGFIKGWVNENEVEIQFSSRGLLKQELQKLGYPISDQVGYHTGEAFSFNMIKNLANGSLFEFRDYQQAAIDSFYKMGMEDQGSGVIVLPCGAGKTVIGLGIMERLSCATLILTSNTTSVKQWKTELLEKTTVHAEQIGEYCGELKQVRPITIATYQILTHRKSKHSPFHHMELFQQRDWGFIIYDEVHLLPAPVFRATADIQATRRLGLTATLVREDGRESDVFSLIGPKRHEAPWKKLEDQGWIAKAVCTEVLVGFKDKDKGRYEKAEMKAKFRLASENTNKLAVVLAIIELHKDESILVIGQYIDQLEALALSIGVPVICGRTSHEEREQLYSLFKAGVLKRLVVSKVANFAVDLPNAAVAIQVSGSFGSRQEEAQRLGRIMRPMEGSNEAYFYSLITRGTREQIFAQKRQLFLIEQGYQYIQKDAECYDLDKTTNLSLEAGYL